MTPGRLAAAASVARAVIFAERRSGPLPDAVEFQQYEDALPGTGSRLVAMVEEEQRHRHKMEALAMTETAAEHRLGQHYAMLALILMLLLVAYFCFAGHPNQGAAIGAAIIIVVLAIFRGEQFAQLFRQREPKPGAKNDRLEGDG